ncbi:MAG: hypothetical protein Q9203_004884, partial [Teloschistes exilis]
MAITSPRHVSFISLVLLFNFIGDVTPAAVNRNIDGLRKKVQPLPPSISNSNMPPVQLPSDAIITPTPNVPSSKLQPTTSIPSLLHPRDTRTSGSDPTGPLSLPGRSSPELMPVAAVVSAVFAGILMTMVSAFAVW